MKRFYDQYKKRLVYVDKKSDKNMWDEWWAQENIEQLHGRDKLCFADQTVVELTRRYLPPGSRILEGGCGLGNNVDLLQRHGYQVVGVDYAEQTVQRLRRFKPDLDIRCDDLRNLSFENGYFNGYWSFGVIEHFYDGFEPVATEMFRVISAGGILFLTVPALSGLRKLKAKCGFFPRVLSDNEVEERFYQYAYTADEVQKRFESLGFTLLHRQNWGVYKGVIDEIPGSKIMMSLFCRLSEAGMEKLLGALCSHMYLFIFRK